MSNFTTPMELSVEIEVFKNGDLFVSCCPRLDVYSQGDTIEKAEKNIVEALNAFVDSCQRRGTLERVLEEAGLLVKEQGATRKRATRSMVMPILSA